MTVADTRSEHQPHDHAVSFYEHDDELLDAVAVHLAPGFVEGGIVFVVATPAHRTELGRKLAATGIDLAAHEAAGTYRSFDARGLLDRFLVDGRPDAPAFRSVVGELVAEAAQAGGPVRIFGEMVALLWDAGDVDGALTLESFWNDLAQQHVFNLFCGYPISAVGAAEHLASAATVCRQHSAVVAPKSYTAPAADVADVPDAETTRFFVPVPLAARAARRFVRETLEAWGGDDISPDAELIASELASNAMLHANSPFRLSLVRGDSGIQLSVQDADPAGLPAAPDQNDDATHGRGMELVDSLAQRWGIDQGDHAKTVWVDLEHPRAV